MADPRSMDGMDSDARQEIKEAVCDAVLDRVRRVVSGEGTYGASILGASRRGCCPRQRCRRSWRPTDTPATSCCRAPACGTPRSSWRSWPGSRRWPAPRCMAGSRSRASARRSAPRGQVLHGFLAKLFPSLAAMRVTHAWNGRVAFAFDHLPHIGQHAGMHYALACDGAGVVMMTHLGQQAARQVVGGGLLWPALVHAGRHRGVPFARPFAGMAMTVPPAPRWPESDACQATASRPAAASQVPDRRDRS
jgi:hypothetical protein